MAETLNFVEKITTSGSSQKFTGALVQGRQYVLTCSEATWAVVAATGGSVSASTGNYIPANVPVPIARISSTLAYLHVLQVTTAGTALLSEIIGGQ